MTTKREDWRYDERTREVKDVNDDAVAYAAVPRDGRRIAAVPDYEAALLEVANCNATFAPCRDCVEVARAALRKGGRIP